MLCLEALPGNLDHLEHLLFDESWCEKYFISRRWPRGFSCSRCERDNIVLSEPDLTTCPACGQKFSITAGTLLHGTKISISQWLTAAWLLCNSYNRLSIRNLQDKLRIKNYQTARNMMQKLLFLKKMGADMKCMGSVELGDCALFLKKEKSNCHLFAAVEINVKNNVTGRIRIFHSHDLSTDSLRRFLRFCVQDSSVVLLPDRQPYLSFYSGRYLTITESTAPHQGAASQVLTAFLASHLNHSSCVFSLKRLERLRDEFCFQENNKLFPDTLAVFENLVARLVKNPDLSSDSSQTCPGKYGGEV